MLTHLLETFGADVTHLATVPDDVEGTREMLRNAAQQTDVVVTTGGVSVGEEDHVKAALESLGRLDLWRLALRPGKPLAWADCRRPWRRDSLRRSARQSGLLFRGRLALSAPLMGALLHCPELAQLPRLSAHADFSTRTGPRRHYMRVKLAFTREGIVAHAYPDQKSGVLSSCVGADALAVIEPDADIAKGDVVDCLWVRGD